MKRKLQFLKTLLVAVGMSVGVSDAWGTDVPTPVYFNNFTSSAGLTIQGTGSFVVDDNPRFGKVFQNVGGVERTNYLLLPNDILSHSADSKELTIGFWVNCLSTAVDYYWAPMFTAYGAAPTDDGDETKSNVSPMLWCGAPKLLQYNTGDDGWCDFLAAQNDKSSNSEGSQWLDDHAWHYYTATFTETSAKVYIDGVLANAWSLDNTSDGQIMTNLFTKGSSYTHICLGGNQRWNQNGSFNCDPAFKFDDIAIYNAALTAEQINQIITDKTTTADITAIPSNYTFNASSTINPFDNGAIWHGTYVDAFLPSMSKNTRGLTATAYFDSNTETDGRQAYTILSGDVVTISMMMYNGYNPSQDNNATAYSVYNSDGTALVSFTYNSKSCEFTDVSFGGTTVEGFEAFNGQSGFNGTNQAANGIDDASKPFVAASGYNPVITISLAGDGNVSVNFVRAKNTAYDKTFSSKLSGVKMDLAKVVMTSNDYGKSGINAGNRISGIGYMNFGLKHTVNVRAVDGSSNKLAVIGTNIVGDGETLQFSYPRYVLNGTTVYKKDATNKEYRITSSTITTSQNIDVVYSQYATDGLFYTEAEFLAGVTVATNSGASSRSSMAALAYGTDIAVTTLPAGTYKATIGWYGKKDETCAVKAGEVTVVSATQNGSWGETLGSTFTLTEPTAVTMTATGNDYTGIDYILIENTGVSATLDAAGYATLASPYALDVTPASMTASAGSATAYKAAVAGTKVNFTDISGNIVANTGILLKGEANATVTIPVVASGSAVSENAFLVNTTGATFTADADYYYFAMKKGEATLTFATFAPSTLAFPANKAYLKVAKSNFPTPAPALTAIFDDGNTTGINTVKNAQFTENGEYYNLAGQRVAQPTKGLYIVNGRKVVVK